MIVFFSTSNRWISRTIRRITGSTVSHVGFLTRAAERTVVMHADVGGIQITDLAKFLKSNTVVAVYDRSTCETEDESCSLKGAVDYLGLSYDYTSIVVRAVLIGLKWMGLKLTNPLRSPRSLVCSEFVARVVSDFRTYDPEQVTPEELLSHCANSDRWKRFTLETVVVDVQ